MILILTGVNEYYYSNKEDINPILLLQDCLNFADNLVKCELFTSTINCKIKINMVLKDTIKCKWLFKTFTQYSLAIDSYRIILLFIAFNKKSAINCK